MRHGRSGGNVAEVLFDLLPRRLRVDVAGHDEHRVGRSVVRLEPFLHVVERCGVEVLHGADDGVRVRMRGRPDGSGDQFLRDGVRLVLSLPLLVLNHAALLVEFSLVDGAEQMAHPVGLEPEHHVQRGDRNVLEVVGAVLVGGAVQISGADFLQRVEVVSVEVLAAVEHQVLEQVREAGLAELLVLRACVVPDVDGHDRMSTCGTFVEAGLLVAAGGAANAAPTESKRTSDNFTTGRMKPPPNGFRRTRYTKG